MAPEIERKYLVNRKKFLVFLQHCKAIKKYLISQTYLQNSAVRVRIIDNKAVLGVKQRAGSEKALISNEIEVKISIDDAHAISEVFSRKTTPIRKTRHEIEYQGKLWMIDIFHNENDGLTMAEIELSESNECYSLPPFIEQEVTSDKRFQNSYLAITPYNLLNKP